MKKINISFNDGDTVKDILFEGEPISDAIYKGGKENFFELSYHCKEILEEYCKEGFRAIMIPDLVLDAFSDKDDLTVSSYIFGGTMAACLDDDFKAKMLSNPFALKARKVKDIYQSYIMLYYEMSKILKVNAPDEHAEIFATTILGCYDMWLTIRKDAMLTEAKKAIGNILKNFLGEDDDKE